MSESRAPQVIDDDSFSKNHNLSHQHSNPVTKPWLNHKEKTA